MPWPKGNGAGWGGPAKGPGKKTDRPLLRGGPGRGHVNEDRLQRNERWKEEMLTLYHDFASDEEKADATRLSAATHLLNRLDGLPVAKTEVSEPQEIRITIEGGLRAQAEESKNGKGDAPTP